MRTQKITRRITPQDRIENVWPLLPFDVRAGDEAVEVELDFDRSRGVVDLGCLGVGPTDEPTHWRGWSGGARSRFAITREAATPGYLPGELELGTWAVVLGLHHIPADGLDVTVTVTTGSAARIEDEPVAPRPTSTTRGSARGLPAPAGRRWIACDLHAHTLHSDGALSIRQLASLATREGLDLLAITDHNTTSHHAHLPGVGAEYGVHLLPGQEITTSRGHANAWGAIGTIDFRRPAEDWFTEVAKRGGLGSINHPLADDCAWQHQLSVAPPCVEILHETWLKNRKWTGPWAFWPAWGLDRTPVGGSDFHNPANGDRLAQPTTWVEVSDRPEIDTDEVLDALRAGRTSLSVGVREAVLLRVEDEIHAIDADGAILIDIAGRSRIIHGAHVILAADTATGATRPGAGRGPYRLETPDREILAICS